jgi:hypothetical protein
VGVSLRDGDLEPESAVEIDYLLNHPGNKQSLGDVHLESDAVDRNALVQQLNKEVVELLSLSGDRLNKVLVEEELCIQVRSSGKTKRVLNITRAKDLRPYRNCLV